MQCTIGGAAGWCWWCRRERRRRRGVIGSTAVRGAEGRGSWITATLIQAAVSRLAPDLDQQLLLPLTERCVAGSPDHQRGVSRCYQRALDEPQGLPQSVEEGANKAGRRWQTVKC